ncbi:oocyte zinc finger protein XlCOF6-like [Culex quinquefasciatus]|uniref:oocyte zinc finger protein XlCOF6-like n=1 Tax=Culex quinquefasciatus TaxID=7176 RepID=UPI0018E35EBD|nr:oocyte zinc finger protein XlCOF6-like [Culex quinquefasciatus]XP_038104872.1 oocyte zinc finger protein XlCOF6-like [Culex quinquefasciatus]XP_038104880.1 oocyte zinc finger protein XlCOF6-like [Culex quinquefasciatus]
MQLGIVADTKMLCRICMVPVVEHPANLYDDASPFGLPSLHDMLRTICAPVFAKPEAEAIVPNMPTIVCLVCRNAIVAAYNLHQQCIETDRRLGELVALMWELQGPGSDEIGEVSEDPPKSSIKEVPMSKETMVESVEIKDQSAQPSCSQRGNADDKTCVECGKTFSSRWTLVRHKREGWCDKTNDPMMRTCDICNKVLKTVQLLKRHRQMHDSRPCPPELPASTQEHTPEGDRPAEESSVLNNEQVDSVKDEALDMMDESQSHNEEEVVDARGMKCTNCGISFSSNLSYRNHMLEKSCQQKQLFPCTKCGKTFDKLTRMQYHRRNHKERLACNLCNQTFKNRDCLRIHHTRKLCLGIETSTSEAACQGEQGQVRKDEPVVNVNKTCLRCGKTFATGWTLKRHKNEGRCEGPNVSMARTCVICCQVFKTVKLLRKHRQIHAGTDGTEQAESDKAELPAGEEIPLLNTEQVDVIKVEALDLTDENEEAVNEVRVFKCTDCGISYSSTASYRKHTLEGNCQGKQLFPCSICGKTFDNATRLKYHLRNHKARVACSKCDLTFKNRMCLRLHHKRNRCSGNKTNTSLAIRQEENSAEEQEQSEEQHQMQGEVNIAEGKSNESLLVEIQPSLKNTAKMNVERDIQCANCGVAFTSNRAHQNHIKDGNCQRKITYPCKKCGMVFDKLTRMHYHMYSHKEREACSKCGTTFGYRSALVRHLKKSRCSQNQTQEQSENQAGQQTPTFPCKICGQIFHSYTRMLYHRRNHQKRVSCPHCDQLFRNKNILHAHIRARRCLIDSASSSQTVVNEEALEIIKVEEPQIMDT